MVWAGVTPELPQESGGLGLASRSGCSWRASLASGMCVWRWGRRPRWVVCALGAGRARDPKEQGPRTRSLAPPRPRVPGAQEPSSGVRDTCRGVSPLQWAESG